MEQKPRKRPMGQKLKATYTIMGVPFLTATFALFYGKMDGPTYSSLLQMMIPLGLAVFNASAAYQRVGIAKAMNPQPTAPGVVVNADGGPENVNVTTEKK